MGCVALADSACVSILFSPQSPQGVYSPLCMTRGLREEMLVASERELLSRWKKATILAEEGTSEKLLSTESTASVVANMDPSLEAEGSSKSYAQSQSTDKRTQLKLLQQQAPIEFLRKQ